MYFIKKMLRFHYFCIKKTGRSCGVRRLVAALLGIDLSMRLLNRMSVRIAGRHMGSGIDKSMLLNKILANQCKEYKLAFGSLVETWVLASTS